MLRVVIILIVLLAGASAIILEQHNHIVRVTQERRQAIDFAKRDSANAWTYKNQLDHQVQRNQITELTLANAREFKDTDRLAYLGELEGVKKNLKNLESAVNVQTSITAQLKLHVRDTTIIVSGDTLHGHKFGYADKYNHITGVLEGDTTALIRAQISVPVEGAMYWQRKKILGLKIGKKKFFSEVTSPNPWVNINNSEFIKIQKR